jgi:CheY-like chemotaxis protein
MDDDLKRIATMSIDLKLILQQIWRYSELSARHHGEEKYVDLFRERLELGSKTAEALFDRVSLTMKNGVGSEPAMVASLAQVRARLQSSKETITKLPNDAIPPDITVKNATGQRELILLIEDEAEVAELAAEILVMEEYRVIIAPNGVEALKIYGRIGQQIGLVILDFFMPIMDGDAVFEELRFLNPEINVVLSSGFAEQNKISAMLADGLRGFIPKPYTSKRLLAQVRSTLDAAREAEA